MDGPFPIGSQFGFRCASKLSGARTIPDAMAVSRDWATRYFQRLAEDGKHFADDTRKFMETGARLFSNEPAAAA